VSSFGQVRLSKIWRMLRKCAPGYKKTRQQHKWRVEFDGRTFPDLPLGSHGSKDPEIQLGVVKKMIRHLRIDPECAYQYLPQVGKPKTSSN